MAEPKPVVVTAVATEDYEGTFAPEPLVLVGGVPISTEVEALTVVATADATDLASAIALSNALKVKVNAIIAALKA